MFKQKNLHQNLIKKSFIVAVTNFAIQSQKEDTPQASSNYMKTFPSIK